MKTDNFTTCVIKIIYNIPKGKVMTYGMIASEAGSPRAARFVAGIIRRHDGHNLPWHRVINSQGKISLSDYNGYALQKSLLLAEGITFNSDDKLDLKVFCKLEANAIDA